MFRPVTEEERKEFNKLLDFDERLIDLAIFNYQQAVEQGFIDPEEAPEEHRHMYVMAEIARERKNGKA